MKCHICHKRFTPHKRTPTSQLYCSRRCNKIAYYRRNRTRLLRKKHDWYHGIRAKLTKPSQACAFCGSIFSSWRTSQRFCNVQCTKNEWASRHRDYMRKVCSDWQRSAAGKRSYQRNHARILHNAHVQSARRRGAPGSHTLDEWDALKRKHKFSCACCGKRVKLTKDHIIPIVKGGSDEITNIQPFCFPCNVSKNSRSNCQRNH